MMATAMPSLSSPNPRGQFWLMLFPADKTQTSSFYFFFLTRGLGGEGWVRSSKILLFHHQVLGFGQPYRWHHRCHITLIWNTWSMFCDQLPESNHFALQQVPKCLNQDCNGIILLIQDFLNCFQLKTRLLEIFLQCGARTKLPLSLFFRQTSSMTAKRHSLGFHC